jgi:molecular chaperone Hsp33
MSKDLLQRFIFENEPVRGEFIKLEDSLQAILQQHDYPEGIQKLLAESLCVAALLSAIIKFTGKLTVQFRGNGKLKLLFAQCDDQYNLRGLVKYDGDLTYEELMESFNDGMLVIMLDSGKKSQRYQGVVAWQGNSLAESVEGYFRNSEQLETKIWLDYKDKKAMGYMLQVIPGKDKQEDEAIAESISLQNIIHQTNILGTDVFFENQYPEFLTLLYPEETIRVFDGTPVRFKCSCNRQRCENAILILGQEEAEEELEGKQSIVVTCDFCNKEYVFDRVDVLELFKRDNPPPDSQLH